VTGKMTGNNRPKNLIKEFANISDEAFALLVLEIYGMYGSKCIH